MLIELLKAPWHWSVSGLSIAFVMYLLLYSGGEFGVSSNLRTLCTIGGAGKFSEFFKTDWRKSSWNLVFVGGSIVGAFLSSQFLMNPYHSEVSLSTLEYLESLNLGTSAATSTGSLGSYMPDVFTNPSPVMMLLLLLGGILVGFGTRYAGGCTSGHAISGLSNLQVPSLIAVVGFFIGGLTMTWLILPFIFGGGAI